MGRVTLENLDEVMTYQNADEDQLKAFKAVREDCIDLGRTILLNVPECADRSEALRKLREVRMDCNAAIALKGLI